MLILCLFTIIFSQKYLINIKSKNTGTFMANRSNKGHNKKNVFLLSLVKNKGNKIKGVLSQKTLDGDKYLYYDKYAEKLVLHEDVHEWYIINSGKYYHLADKNNNCLEAKLKDHIKMNPCDFKRDSQKFIIKSKTKKKNKKKLSVKLKGSDKKKGRHNEHTDDINLSMNSSSSSENSTSSSDFEPNSDNLKNEFSFGSKEHSLPDSVDIIQQKDPNSSLRVSEELKRNTEYEPAVIKKEHVSNIISSTIKTTIIIDSTSTKTSYNIVTEVKTETSTSTTTITSTEISSVVKPKFSSSTRKPNVKSVEIRPTESRPLEVKHSEDRIIVPGDEKWEIYDQDDDVLIDSRKIRPSFNRIIDNAKDKIRNMPLNDRDYANQTSNPRKKRSLKQQNEESDRRANDNDQDGYIRRKNTSFGIDDGLINNRKQISNRYPSTSTKRISNSRGEDPSGNTNYSEKKGSKNKRINPGNTISSSNDSKFRSRDRLFNNKENRSKRSSEDSSESSSDEKRNTPKSSSKTNKSKSSKKNKKFHKGDVGSSVRREGINTPEDRVSVLFDLDDSIDPKDESMKTFLESPSIMEFLNEINGTEVKEILTNKMSNKPVNKIHSLKKVNPPTNLCKGGKDKKFIEMVCTHNLVTQKPPVYASPSLITSQVSPQSYVYQPQSTVVVVSPQKVSPPPQYQQTQVSVYNRELNRKAINANDECEQKKEKLLLDITKEINDQLQNEYNISNC